VKLEIIAALTAWTTESHEAFRLPVGTLVTAWRIVRGDIGDEQPYLVYFDSDGLEYCCALHQFLPRTQSVQLVAESMPLETAVAV
jgi:hypothetical protein